MRAQDRACAWGIIGRMSQDPGSFNELQRVLIQAHALTDAAEAHGTLVGSLCSTPCSLADWLADILPEGSADPASAASLRGVFDATSGALGEGMLKFRPLLPTDDESLDDRTAALGEWCQGFLYGLGAGVRTGSRHPARARRPKSCATSPRSPMWTWIRHDGSESNEAGLCRTGRVRARGCAAAVRTAAAAARTRHPRARESLH